LSAASFFDFPKITIFIGKPQANTRGALFFGSLLLIRDIHVAHPPASKFIPDEFVGKQKK
jgi:hypothetical protein